MLIPDIAVCDRRRFCQGFTGVAAGLFLGEVDTLFAAESCQRQDIKLSESAIAWPRDGLLMWLDGLLGERRARLAFLCKVKQTPQSFVSKVVLATSDKTSLGVRYFEANDKLSDGYLPYLIFDNIDLTVSKLYFLILQIVEGNQTKIYRYPIEAKSLRRQNFPATTLPAVVAADFANTSHRGAVYSPFYSPMRLTKGDGCPPAGHCLEAHRVKARLVSIASDGLACTIAFEVGHGDVSLQHYYRYFLVTDPVGRIVGLSKRNYGETASAKRVIVEALTLTAAKDLWKLPQELTARIGDCPYLKVFAEDVGEGVFSADVILR